MAKISIKSLNGSVLEGEHDQWKEEILLYEPTEVDTLMSRYDRWEEKFAGSLVATDGSQPISEGPSFRLAGVRSSGSQADPIHPEEVGVGNAFERLAMVSRVNTPVPQFRRHGEPAPVQASQESEPEFTVTTTMEPSPRNYKPQLRRHNEPAPVQAPVPPPHLRLREEVTFRTPLKFARPAPKLDPRDAEIQRRKEIQDRFNQNVQAARQHAADVLAKVGNAK